MYDDSSADDAARSEEGDDVIGVRSRNDAIGIGHDISQIADVANGILTSAVVNFVGVVMASGAPIVRK